MCLPFLPLSQQNVLTDILGWGLMKQQLHIGAVTHSLTDICEQLSCCAPGLCLVFGEAVKWVSVCGHGRMNILGRVHNNLHLQNKAIE